ncbi:MAG: UDP-3-O-(3-hydroxymyristoyl)glucosamine N-acyltransferase [Candidatus Omnitrophica bacterium]|nr:UDP-3-O-(3-hydroxymyristoyl)glucosamine N-acyltransferase [Candidatus Omnitrophota bacterium]
MIYTAKELAQFLKAAVIGDGEVAIHGITNIEAPSKACIAFVQNKKDLPDLEKTELACLIVPKDIQSSTKTIIPVEHPKMAWAALLRLFHPALTFSGVVSAEASVDTSAKLGANVTVEPFARISANAVIDAGAVVRSFVFVGENVRIGQNSILHPGVVIYENSVIGQNVTIHAGSVIGADGFGYIATFTKQEKVPQVGNVVIEDDVEIGSCTTIDRATVGSTVIGKDTKIDNQVQIAHNVVIGPHTAISAQSGISGSCKIGAHVTMGGKAGLGDHVEIGDWVMVGAGAGFPSNKKIPSKQIVFGQPARPYSEARRQIGAQLRSAETLDEVRDLKKRVAALENLLAAKS